MPPSDLAEQGVNWADLILAVLMGMFFLVMARLVILRHNEFWTFDFDLAIFDQAIWLLSKGESFITIRGLSVFGHHANIGFLVLVPFYWLGAGANFLNVVMVATLTLGALPLYRYGLQLFQSGWYALVPPAAFLLHFTTGWLVNETFHPEVIAITPLMFAYVSASRQQWRPYVWWLIAAAIWKEDVALAIMMIGVVVWIRGHRRIGFVTAGLSLAWFLYATRVMIPAFSDGGAFYNDFFGPLGSGVMEVVVTSVTKPSLVISAMTQHDALGYLRDLLVPYALTPLAAPTALLIGLPQFLINMLTAHGLPANLQAHYVAIPLAAASLALVEGIARVRHLSWKRFALGAVGAFSIATSVAWGVLPFAVNYDAGNWPLFGNDRRPIMEQAVRLPQPTASVSATWNLVPHLAHRRHVYTFPNPWVSVNWGTGTEKPPDPAVIEWLVIDKTVLGVSAAEFESVIAAESWEVVMDQNGVFVAKRAP
jgi:uncharacterized membrane protein